MCFTKSESNSFSQKVICINSHKTRIWICLRIPKMNLTNIKQVANGRALLTEKSLKCSYFGRLKTKIK